jgi:polysaccharide pyruvyl transferase WcaK-like protein
MLSLFNGSKISIAGFGTFPLMAKMRGARFDVMGLGVGPLTTPDAKLMVNFLARETDTITVRDPKSTALLDSFLDNEIEVVCAPDTVYAIELPETNVFEDVEAARAEGRLIVGVNLRPWSRGVGIEPVKRNVTQALIDLAKTRDIFVYGVPMQEGASYDRKVLAEVLAALPDDVPHGMIPEPLSMQGFFDGCAGLDVLLSMRLHANLVAHRMHVPCVGLAYDPKLVAHFKELGRSKYCLELDAEPALMVEAMQRAAKSKGLTKSQTGKLAALETEALGRLREVAKQIAATPSRNAIWDIPPAKVKPAPKAAVARAGAPAANRLGNFTAGRASSFMPTASDNASNAILGDRATFASPDSSLAILGDRATFASPDSSLNLDLRKCSFQSTAKTDLDVRSFELQKNSAWFSWPSDGPSAGQTASLSFDCEGGDAGSALNLNLTTFYGNGDRVGHVMYRVSVDGNVLAQCDLASAKGMFEMTVFLPANKTSNVKFELIALQNLESWNWVKSSRIRLSDASLKPANVSETAKIAAMNPHWIYSEPGSEVSQPQMAKSGPLGTGIVAALKRSFGK